MKNKFYYSLHLILMMISFSVYSQNWKLVWSDEFESPAVNTANWKFETGGGGWGNNELEFYTDRTENAKIIDGHLNIIAKKENFQGSAYTSARLKTQGLKFWKYGKIEAKIKIPTGKGIWPAFWMLGENIDAVGWPKCGEIDIMEHVSNEPDIVGTIHWDAGGHASYGGNTPFDKNIYNIYAIEWDQQSIQWFLNGNKYHEANISNAINSTEEFHESFFILLNLAVGGNWPTNPDQTTVFPDTMSVDYVRVYQQDITAVEEVDGKLPSMRYDASSGLLQIHLSSASGTNCSISLVDILGNRRALFSPQYLQGSESVSIDLSTLPSGINFIEVVIDGIPHLYPLVK